MKAFAIAVWAVLFLGIVPFALLWRRPPVRWPRYLLATMTASYIWCLLGIVYPPAIGPHYSDLRLTIIQFNLWVSVVLALAALRLLEPRPLAIAAAVWLLSVWLYIRSVSFVV